MDILKKIGELKNNVEHELTLIKELEKEVSPTIKKNRIEPEIQWAVQYRKNNWDSWKFNTIDFNQIYYNDFGLPAFFKTRNEAYDTLQELQRSDWHGINIEYRVVFRKIHGYHYSSWKEDEREYTIKYRYKSCVEPPFWFHSYRTTNPPELLRFQSKEEAENELLKWFDKCIVKKDFQFIIHEDIEIKLFSRPINEYLLDTDGWEEVKDQPSFDSYVRQKIRADDLWQSLSGDTICQKKDNPKKKEYRVERLLLDQQWCQTSPKIFHNREDARNEKRNLKEYHPSEKYRVVSRLTNSNDLTWKTEK